MVGLAGLSKDPASTVNKLLYFHKDDHMLFKVIVVPVVCVVIAAMSVYQFAVLAFKYGRGGY